jgi:hypothetical protein
MRPQYQDNPHAQWAHDDRERFLDELLRHDGRGDYVGQILCGRAGCGRPNPKHRCIDCLDGCLYCKDCVQDIHYRSPLHHIEVSSRFGLVCTVTHRRPRNGRAIILRGVR